MKIIFLGAPGAGKGTQAERLSQDLSIPTISTGAIIRQAIQGQTPLGQQAAAYTKTGALVPDEVMIGIIQERLAQPDCAGGYILDGFPRTIEQAEALERLGIKLDAVIEIQADDEFIVARLAGRRVCPVCGATYHMTNRPPKDGVHCDCGGELIIRADDAPETVRNRLAVYHQQTEPLIDYYRHHGRFISVDGTQQVETAHRQILAALRK